MAVLLTNWEANTELFQVWNLIDPVITELLAEGIFHFAASPLITNLNPNSFRG